MRTSKDWHGCPIRYGATVLGDPWCLLVLRDIMFKSGRHFADFMKAGENISTNILASRLTQLENEGVLFKTKDPNNGTRYIYSLTGKGVALIPVMLEIIDWSETWDDQTEVPSDFANRLNKDKGALAQSIAEKFKVA